MEKLELVLACKDSTLLVSSASGRHESARWESDHGYVRVDLEGPGASGLLGGRYYKVTIEEALDENGHHVTAPVAQAQES